MKVPGPTPARIAIDVKTHHSVMLTREMKEDLFGDHFVKWCNLNRITALYNQQLRLYILVSPDFVLWIEPAQSPPP